MNRAARPIAMGLGAAIAGLGAILPHGAGATPGMARVAVDSAIYVERREDLRRVLEPADRLHPGDRVVTVVTWKRAAPGAHGASGGFTVTNPLPRALAYQGSGADAEEVSIDGGRNWGRLDALRIGQRRATPEDVTHVRWRVASPAPEGRIAYSAIVR